MKLQEQTQFLLVDGMDLDSLFVFLFLSSAVVRKANYQSNLYVLSLDNLQVTQ